MRQYARQKRAHKLETKGYQRRSDRRDVQELNGDSDNQHYAFGLDVSENIRVIDNERIVTVTTDRVPVDFVNDSGTTCNIIDETTWNNCKCGGIKCVSKKGSNKQVFAYGNYELDLLGESKYKIEVGKMEKPAEFVVLKGKEKTIIRLSNGD